MQPTTHRQWTESRVRPIPKGFRDIFRRTESQEDMNGGLGKQREDESEPQFITSAIEMDNSRPLQSFSIDSATSRQSVEDGKKCPDPYRVV